MPDDLLRGPVEQAERSSAPVRAAALLRISRVETVTSPGAARKTFDGALESVRRLFGTDREFLLEQAAFIAAAVAPDLLQTPELAPPHSFESTLLEIMLDHGHVQDAVSRLASQDDASEFQFDMAHVLMTRVNGADAKLAVFRRAIEAWRNAPPYDEMRPPDGTFVEVFRWEWNLLPQEEALTLVREIVRLTAEQPEQPITAKYGPDVEITSWRAHIYFQLLDVLRRLDPQLADSLIAKNAQLKKAARRFPNGLTSMEEEAERRRLEHAPSGKPGRILMESPEDFPYLESLHRALADGDFEPPLEYALEKYQKDSDPKSLNRAPRELWPSAAAYRTILYRAGKQLGADAAGYLERIPDEDLRLFARIELAAALAGLPEMRGVSREYRGRDRAQNHRSAGSRR
jgi:hypothetical protein